MNLWYITVLVITTLSPPEGYMQYTQGFKDEASLYLKSYNTFDHQLRMNGDNL